MIRFLLPLLLLVTPAAADELMTFFIKNGASRGVALEMSSRTREMLWPGDDKVYFLEPGEKKSVPIQCQVGEEICYGAWVVGDPATWWGAGPNGDRDCPSCCSICVAKTTETIDLRE